MDFFLDLFLLVNTFQRETKHFDVSFQHIRSVNFPLEDGKDATYEY